MTEERFKKLIEQIKVKQLKKKKREEKQKALLREKKRKEDKRRREREKASEKALKPQIKETHNTIPIYLQPYIERETAEGDLYTLEELKNIEELFPNESGRINWEVWSKLTKKKDNKL